MEVLAIAQVIDWWPALVEHQNCSHFAHFAICAFNWFFWLL
jgi:hypothetical protein